jgi:8-oxo-dGTP diphosphatase
MKQVVCALIVKDGKLLITQHGETSGRPWKWEFPGGKVHPGEKPENALVREVMEELSIAVEIEMELEPVDYHYPGKDIHLIPYLCRWVSGTIYLHEHIGYQWIDPADIRNYDMLPADFLIFEKGSNRSRLLGYAGENAEDRRKHNAPTNY